MFSGYGIYHGGVIFAIFVDGSLYMKADSENLIYFEREGLPRFEYVRKGKKIAMSYYLVPDEVMDDREVAAEWARRSFEAAMRARPPVTRKKKSQPAVRRSRGS